MSASMNTFLFAEPSQHYLNYGSLVLHEIVAKNKGAGQIITELIGDDANPDKIKQELNALNPIVFCIIGHGSETTITAECTAKLFDTSSPDLNLLAKRVCSFCSCLTAVYFGPAIIDAGAVAYTGYKTEFWFFIGDAPGSTRAVQSPFLAEFEFIASLLRGSSTGVARSDQLKKCDEEIAYWISGEGKNHESAGELSRILEMNKANSVFLGEGGVSPSSGAVAAAGFSSWPWVLAFLITGVLAYRELKGKS